MKTVDSSGFAKPKGPFSYATISHGFVFVSGLASLDLSTGQFEYGDIKLETENTLLNIQRVLKIAGTDLNHIVKCSVFLKDINDFSEMNQIYERFFPVESQRPARVTVQAVLGSKIKIEIDAIAELPERKADL